MEPVRNAQCVRNQIGSRPPVSKMQAIMLVLQMHVTGLNRFFPTKDIVRIVNLATNLTLQIKSAYKNQTTNNVCLVLVIGVLNTLIQMAPAKIVQNASNQISQKQSVKVNLTFCSAWLMSVTGTNKFLILMVNVKVVENVRSQHGINHYVSNQQTTTSA